MDHAASADIRSSMPTSSTRLIAGLTGKKLPAGVMSQSLAHVTYTDDPLPATFRTMAQWSYDLGFATQRTNLDRLFDLQHSPTTRPTL